MSYSNAHGSLRLSQLASLMRLFKGRAGTLKRCIAILTKGCYDDLISFCGAAKRSTS